MDQLRARLGVLHLRRRRRRRGPTPARSNASRAASTEGEGAISSGSDGLKTSNDPGLRVRNATERSQTGRASGRRARYSRRQTTSAAAPSPGEQSMYWVSGCASIGAREDLLGRQRRPAPGVRRERSVAERLLRDLRERRAPECRGRACSAAASRRRTASSPSGRPRRTTSGSDQSAGSFWKAPRGCLSKPTTSADVVRARLERAHRGDERRASGRAAVLDVHEREPRRAEVGDHRVGVARVLAAAVGELDVAPRRRRRRRARRGRRARPSRGRSTPSCRPNGWIPAPTIAISASLGDGLRRARRRRSVSPPRSSATTSIGMPIRRPARVGSRSAAPRRGGARELDVADRERRELAGARPIRRRLRLEALRRPRPERPARAAAGSARRSPPQAAQRARSGKRRRRRSRGTGRPRGAARPSLSSSGAGSTSAQVSDFAPVARSRPARGPTCRRVTPASRSSAFFSLCDSVRGSSGDVLDEARHPVARHALREVVDELGRIERRAVLEHDDDLHLLVARRPRRRSGS